MNILKVIKNARVIKYQEELIQERGKLQELLKLVSLRQSNTEHARTVETQNLRRDGTRRQACSREVFKTDGLFDDLEIRYREDLTSSSESEEELTEDEDEAKEDKEDKEVLHEADERGGRLLARDPADAGVSNVMKQWISEYTTKEEYVRPLVVYPTASSNISDAYTHGKPFEFQRYQGANTTVGFKTSWEQMIEGHRTHRGWTRKMHMKYAIRRASDERKTDDTRLVHALFDQQGFLPTTSASWHCLWTNETLPASQFRSLTCVQRVNQFPGSENLHDRVLFAKFTMWLRDCYQDEYNAVPCKFVLPQHHQQLRTYRENHPDEWYFMEKIDALHHRKGTPEVIQSQKDIPKTKQRYIVTRLLRHPLLLLQRQVEIHIFASVTCFDPLRIYLYRDGIVYLRHPFHWPENEMSKGWGADGEYVKKRWGIDEDDDIDPVEDHLGRAHRDWTWLQTMLHQRGFDEVVLWKRIQSVIVKTLVGLQGKVKPKLGSFVRHRRSCYEVFDFKFILDRGMKPWLLKVSRPRLGAISAVELAVVSGAIADTLNMIRIRPEDPVEVPKKRRRHRVKRRNTRLLGRKVKLGKKREHVDMATPSELYMARSKLTDPLLAECEKAIFNEMEEELERKGQFVRVYPCQGFAEFEDFFAQESVLKKIILKKMYGRYCKGVVEAEPEEENAESSEPGSVVPRTLRLIHNDDDVLLNLTTGKWNSLTMRPQWIVHKAIKDIHPGPGNKDILPPPQQEHYRAMDGIKGSILQLNIEWAERQRILTEKLARRAKI